MILAQSQVKEQTAVLINDLFDAILKRAQEAKANGIRPRLTKTKTEYFITIPQGYKTRAYKVLIIQTDQGVTVQTYDRRKLQYNEKVPDTTMDEVLRKLPLDFMEISMKDGVATTTTSRPRSDS